ncbi:DDE-type integrase/transposase/recombinase [Amycolatopsis sp. 195334CR]|uniref:DDE-type integrase/transposase/recombinase n=1 Tax=Amycolatopsis sp. 195334CR TaxID=2814588 RepID=UPI001A900928|nr:DDE-type integrase/transposase/recombinase [Amycolatopsis sp. 195334CR]MBN6040078.1 DDE-type integrase/transposase/recombinase [Amycolatopsis sp. 195334CR]
MLISDAAEQAAWPQPAAARSTRLARRHVGPEERARVVDRLVTVRAQGEPLAPAVERMAFELGVSIRTIYRWLQRGPGHSRPRSARRYQLTTADRQAFQDHHGSVASAYRARCAVLAGESTCAGVDIPSHLRAGWRDAQPVSPGAFYAAFRRELDQAERAFWRHGEQARRAHRAYLQRTVEHRNQIWQADHTQLDILVCPRRGQLVRPWLTTFVDVHSRVVLGWALSKATRPDSGTVLCALRDALIRDPDTGDHGGVPAIIECDHGKEFTAEAIGRALASLDIRLRQVETYEGRGKAFIERWHHTISQLLLVQLPGYTGGPRNKQGQLHDLEPDLRHRPLLTADVAITTTGAATAPAFPAVLSFAAFCTTFQNWVLWFNHNHRHRGLLGLTPLQRWRADRTALTTVSADLLRDLLLVSKDRTLTTRGFALHGVRYVAEDLQGEVGTRYDIRHAPHDHRFIEIYRDQQWLATGFPADVKDEQQRQQYHDRWNERGRQLTREKRQARARLRLRAEPVTHAHTTPTTGPAADQTLRIPHTAPEPPAPAATTSAGSMSLLGIRPTLELAGPPPDYQPPTPRLPRQT